MIEYMDNTMEVSMGEAKRRKALGFGSAKGKDWKEPTNTILIIDWRDLGFKRAVDYLLNLRLDLFSSHFGNTIRIEDIFAFVSELLDRASVSHEWAVKRDCIANVLRVAHGSLFIGDPINLEGIEFIEKAIGRPLNFRYPPTKDNFDQLSKASLLGAVQ
jgi:hypothetical protein